VQSHARLRVPGVVPWRTSRSTTFTHPLLVEVGDPDRTSRSPATAGWDGIAGAPPPHLEGRDTASSASGQAVHPFGPIVGRTSSTRRSCRGPGRQWPPAPLRWWFGKYEVWGWVCVGRAAERADEAGAVDGSGLATEPEEQQLVAAPGGPGHRVSRYVTCRLRSSTVLELKPGDWARLLLEEGLCWSGTPS
jgi:hypothetical protein